MHLQSHTQLAGGLDDYQLLSSDMPDNLHNHPEEHVFYQSRLLDTEADELTQELQAFYRFQLLHQKEES
jgi:hypothetical protein